MKIILTETVQGLGEAGTVKEVADGYARNYLLPKKLAVVATRGSVKAAEAQAELYARKAGKAREQTQKAASLVDGKTVLIRARVGSENRLYGSVTPADVADALLAQHGITVDRRRITIAEAIHRTGTYGATADFGNGVTAQFNVEVAPEVAGASGNAPRAGAGAAAQATAQGQAPDATQSAGEDGSPSDAIDEVIHPATGSSDQEMPGPQAEAAEEQQAEANPT